MKTQTSKTQMPTRITISAALLFSLACTTSPQMQDDQVMHATSPQHGVSKSAKVKSIKRATKGTKKSSANAQNDQDARDENFACTAARATLGEDFVCDASCSEMVEDFDVKDIVCLGAQQRQNNPSAPPSRASQEQNRTRGATDDSNSRGVDACALPAYGFFLSDDGDDNGEYTVLYNSPNTCIYVDNGDFVYDAAMTKADCDTNNFTWSSGAIGGFQFNVQNASVVSASGGAASTSGLSTSSSSSMVLAFSLSGGTIPAGCGTLINVTLTDVDGPPILSNIIVSDADGNALPFSYYVQGCLEESACNYNSNAVFDDGSCTYPQPNFDCDGNCIIDVDCAGTCGGNKEFDECDVCDGPGPDCAGICGGNTPIDECGVCGGDNSSCDSCDDFGYACGTLPDCFNPGEGNDFCDCQGHVNDCDGVCNGPNMPDACGECGGTETNWFNCNLNLNLNFDNLWGEPSGFTCAEAGQCEANYGILTQPSYDCIHYMEQTTHSAPYDAIAVPESFCSMNMENVTRLVNNGIYAKTEDVPSAAQNWYIGTPGCANGWSCYLIPAPENSSGTCGDVNAFCDADKECCYVQSMSQCNPFGPSPIECEEPSKRGGVPYPPACGPFGPATGHGVFDAFTNPGQDASDVTYVPSGCFVVSMGRSGGGGWDPDDEVLRIGPPGQKVEFYGPPPECDYDDGCWVEELYCGPLDNAKVECDGLNTYGGSDQKLRWNVSVAGDPFFCGFGNWQDDENGMIHGCYASFNLDQWCDDPNVGGSFDQYVPPAFWEGSGQYCANDWNPNECVLITMVDNEGDGWCYGGDDGGITIEAPNGDMHFAPPEEDCIGHLEWVWDSALNVTKLTPQGCARTHWYCGPLDVTIRTDNLSNYCAPDDPFWTIGIPGWVNACSREMSGYALEADGYDGIIPSTCPRASLYD